MRDEVVAALAGVPAGWIVDATLGGGGHSEALLRAREDVTILGLDRDQEALAAAAQRLAPYAGRVRLWHGPFGAVAQALEVHGIAGVSGVIADLGVSSAQLDRGSRGFSFRFDGPLDMRMDQSTGARLVELLGSVRQEELAGILRGYGDVDRPGRAARVICEAIAEGVDSTAELATRVARVLPGPSRIHPATQVFQALRMWVNDEAGELHKLLAAIPPRLVPGGVMAVVSFHSGEDRLVKHGLRALVAADRALTLPTRRAIFVSDAEAASNPRARSARLRLLARVSEPRQDAREALEEEP